MPPGLPGKGSLTHCMLAQIDGFFLEYEATSSHWKRHLKLDYLSGTSPVWSLDIGLCASKRISLDSNYFMVILIVKV